MRAWLPGWLVLLAACSGSSSLPGAPGDSWSCDCACDDPSSPGAAMTVPVHGCASTGIEESDPNVVEKVCTTVCGLGRSPRVGTNAFIGTCRTPASGARARLVVPNTCDPSNAPAGTAPVDGGEYHVTIDPSLSSMMLRADSLKVNTPVHGGIFFELDDGGTATAIGIQDLEFGADDSASITDLRIAIAEQTGGMSFQPPTFAIYNGLGVLAVRWRQDGEAQGINSVNYDLPWTGTVDVAGAHFTLDVSGHDPASTNRTLSAHLEGTIDNLPPVANAGPMQQTVNCTARAGTPVVVDAATSSDPDPGDSILYYQWFTPTATGLGNQPQTTLMVPVGETARFVLHVYDQRLAAATTETAVIVVETTPPCP